MMTLFFFAHQLFARPFKQRVPKDPKVSPQTLEPRSTTLLFPMIATSLNKFPTTIFDVCIVTDAGFVIGALIVRIGQFIFDIDELTLLFT